MPRIPAHQHVVFDHHRQRADRFDDAANLRGRADVNAIADLRARADERMRIDERALVDVGADVDEHRRHADHAPARRRRRRGSTIRRARCGCRRPRRDSSAASCPCRRTAGRPVMSTVSPKRKPSRMPCLTQVLTRHPVGDDASRSADRTSPALKAERAARRRPRAPHPCPQPCRPRRAVRLCDCSVIDVRVRHASRRPLADRARCRIATIFSCDAGLGEHHRQPEHLFAESHRGHRELHRARDSTR